VDIEDQLLEANRQRLLRKQDWAGLVPSRPMSMHFASRKEKEGIGKRRRVHGRPAIQHRGGREHTETSPFGEKHPDRALRAEAKDIRIRIGFNALTSQTPIQRSDYARSQEAESSPGQVSDPMLFDFTEALQTTASVRASRSRSPSTFSHAAAGPQQSAPHTSHPGKGRNSTPACDADQGPTRRHHAVSEGDQDLHYHPQEPAPNNAPQRKEEVGFVFPMAQPSIDCRQGPFRFTFEKSPDYAVGGMRVALQDNLSNSSALKGGQASCSDLGQAKSQNGNVRGESSGDKTPTPPLAIVDDAPWKTFVAVLDENPSYSGSSYTGRCLLSRTLAVQPTISSQPATLGDHTRISSSSCASASLPSIVHADGRPNLSLSQQAAGAAISGRQSQDADESERLWKTFVFDSGEDHASQIVYDNSIREGKRIAVSTRNRLPSSGAVGATVSSPFVPTSRRSASPLHLRLSDNVQHAAHHAPPSMSPGAGPHYPNISPIPRAYAEMIPRRIGAVTDTHMNGVLQATEPSRLRNGVYASQIPLLNDVPDDRNHSFSMPLRSGLDHTGRQRAKNRSVRPDWDKERESSRYAECSSIYDLPVSDRDG
jgi:hypothetical protein